MSPLGKALRARDHRADAARLLHRAANEAGMAGDIDRAVELRNQAQAFAPLCSDPLQEGCGVFGGFAHVAPVVGEAFAAEPSGGRRR